MVAFAKLYTLLVFAGLVARIQSSCVKPASAIDQAGFEAYLKCIGRKETCANADADILNIDVCDSAGPDCDVDMSSVSCPLCPFMPKGSLFVHTMCPKRCNNCNLKSADVNSGSSQAPERDNNFHPVVKKASGKAFHDIMAMLTSRRLSKNDRPNDNSPTDVAVTWGIRHIGPPDLKAGTFSVSGEMAMWWVDTRLSWNASEYGGAGMIQIDRDLPFEMWVPSLEFDVTVRTPSEINKFTRVYNYGLIVFARRDIFQLSCRFNLAAYPFDTQKCLIRMEAASMPATDVTYRLPSKAENLPGISTDIVESVATTGDFFVRAPTAKPSRSTYYGLDISGIEFEFTFVRSYRKALVRIFIPIWCVMLLSVTALYVDMNAVPARAALVATSVLTLISLNYTVTQSLPPVAYLLDVEVYYVANLILAVCNALAFALINRIDAKLKSHEKRIESQEKVLGEGHHKLTILGSKNDDDNGVEDATLAKRKKKWAKKEREAWKADLREMIHDLEFIGGGHLQAAELQTSLFQMGMNADEAAEIVKQVELNEKGKLSAQDLFSLLQNTEFVLTRRPRSIVCFGIGASRYRMKKMEAVYKRIFVPAYIIL